MQAGDRVYYLYTDSSGNQVKYAAVVLESGADGVLIRVGRYDVDTREIKTFESAVDPASLEARSIPCSYEDALEGSAG
ncbi:MAG: hypothetical protein PVI79_10395 [Gammaproteobacteria bacterium]|jgi:hypothetical protein